MTPKELLRKYESNLKVAKRHKKDVSKREQEKLDVKIEVLTHIIEDLKTLNPA